ncbi:type II toxin-antitoxin system death-on-curing family toxin [Stenoxybacter acetivorans]|uniref:type II toxin-antitoxin system death-on-curing family toxin n=1 Tax=Stenoxybacter acetivorans TaxID=422441 RepID=UPI0009FC0BA0|nr:type II toxin-antitoxin system death-on-curing family toxin [Stenoxybacter acetivorans]
MNTFQYPTLAEIIETHDTIIDKSGGLHGLRDIGLLESALTAIQNDLYYPDFQAKIAHLIFSVNKNHCFNDGNKRTSLSAGELFLLKNGYQKRFTAFFVKQMEDVVILVADNHMSKETLTMVILMLLARNEIDQSGQQDSINMLISELVETQSRLHTAIKILEHKYHNIVECWRDNDISKYRYYQDIDKLFSRHINILKTDY